MSTAVNQSNQLSNQSTNISGREINKLAVAWQASAYGYDPPVFNEALMMEVLETHTANKVNLSRACNKTRPQINEIT